MRPYPDRLPLGAGLAFLLLALAAPPLPAQAPRREGPWILNDLAEARREALRTGKPIFAVFRCER